MKTPAVRAYAAGITDYLKCHVSAPMIKDMQENYNICFISGRLGGIDGVSMEAAKWISNLGTMGHRIFTVAGEYPRLNPRVPDKRRLLIPALSFDSERQEYYEKRVFPHLEDSEAHLAEDELQQLKDELWEEGLQIASEIYDFLLKNSIDLIIAENTNAMPMTLLGAVAVYDLTETREVAAVFHHHDFWWERSRYSDCLIDDVLHKIMPPVSISNEHVVLSSYAEHMLTSVKRIRPYLIPDCENFENPTVRDEYNGNFRKDFGFSEEDLLVVQPTRIVPRKRIEDSLKLCSVMKKKYPDLAKRVKFIVTLYPGDEAECRYPEKVQEAAREAGVELHLIHKRIRPEREVVDGLRCYTNSDVLVNADIVCYMPRWEGFGNSLLEAFAARVPVVVSTYLVYKTDIKGSGVRPVEVRDRYDREGELIIDESTVDEIYSVLTDPVDRRLRVDVSFESASREFGFTRLKESLQGILVAMKDEIHASGKRMDKSRQSYYV